MPRRVASSSASSAATATPSVSESTALNPPGSSSWHSGHTFHPATSDHAAGCGETAMPHSRHGARLGRIVRGGEALLLALDHPVVVPGDDVDGLRRRPLTERRPCLSVEALPFSLGLAGASSARRHHARPRSAAAINLIRSAWSSVARASAHSRQTHARLLRRLPHFHGDGCHWRECSVPQRGHRRPPGPRGPWRMVASASRAWASQIRAEERQPSVGHGLGSGHRSLLRVVRNAIRSQGRAGWRRCGGNGRQRPPARETGRGHTGPRRGVACGSQQTSALVADVPLSVSPTECACNEFTDAPAGPLGRAGRGTGHRERQDGCAGVPAGRQRLSRRGW